MKSSSRQYTAWLMMAPFVLIFATFTLWPLIRSIQMAMTKTAGPQAQEFIGLGNFAFLLHDARFWRAAGNTILYTGAFVAVSISLALLLAIAVDQKRLRSKTAFRYAFFCPHLVGSVFAAVIFSQVFARDGWLNLILISIPNNVSVWFSLVMDFYGFSSFPTLHLTPPTWLQDPSLALWAIVLCGVWLSTGYMMIYLLAALQAVDKQLLEAAAIDGAGPIARFWHVTLPSIRPTLLFLVLSATIGALQLFELPYLLTGGAGPRDSTLTIVGYLYSEGFETGNLGYASAVGWSLVVLCVAISALQLRHAKFHRDE